MSAEPMYVRRDVMDATIDEDLILFDEQGGKYYATSDVGRAIWQQLAKPISVPELCDRLLADYEVSAEECVQETREFVEELVAAGLVTLET